MEQLLKYAVVVFCTAGPWAGVGISGTKAKNCCCRDNGDYSQCDLAAVPRALPATVTVLDLSHNRIGAIRLGDFSSTPKLEVLILAFNRIRTIEAGALRDVPLVRYLDLYQNELPAVPEEALIDLPNLQTLNISMNNYTSFALGGAFSRMSQLQSLSIGTSHTSELHASDLQALSSIPLKHLWLNTGSPLKSYEQGALANLAHLEKLFTNVSIDDDLSILSKMLLDLGTTRISEITIINILINQVHNQSIDLFSGLAYCPLLKNVMLISANLTNLDIVSLLKNIYLSEVTSVTLTNSSYTDFDNVVFPNLPTERKAALETVIIDGIFHMPMTYPLFYIPFSLFPNFSKFKLSNTGLNKVDCLFMTFPGKILDFSNNLLVEDGMWLPKCPQKDNLINTTHLIISHNRFSDLNTIAQKVVVMPNIKSLDLSYNSINHIQECSAWPSTLETLILRNNDISKDSKICISEYLQVLDLSYTRLETFTQNILNDGKSLRELYLSGNNIKYILPELYSPSLQVLYVDNNGVGIIGENTFRGLENIKTLYLGNNPYYCFCDLYWFQQTFEKQLLKNWPNEYRCSYPNELSNRTLSDLNLSIITCDKRIIISMSVGITAFIIILILGLGYYFDAIWYIRMGTVWISAKRRRMQQGAGGPFQYHAFISYSQLDSDWVENTLVPTLESSNPDLKLCIHERDFMPGEWIVDNIIQCIEHSNKTLFILSRNFVNSEWCHYELYFAQHRVLEQRQDSLVLLLLEPLPRNSVPSKFCRLRKLLNRKTYLEWPAEEGKRSMFWASLRAVLQSDHEPSNPNSNHRSISTCNSNPIRNPYV
ncbi:toll-like receptor 2 [Petromyzon marinus]|uniref:toll-like receptor 2 n=1 Tax=Petromyzon marinus TaxID=7757 RepID=UPI003F726DA0